MCMYVCAPQRPEWHVRFLSLELQTAARHHMGGYWELNHCPLEKQPGLLIAETSFSP